MATDQSTERFLEIEKAAGDLVQTLEALRAEVQHYSAASASLDEARTAIGPAAAKYAELAGQIESLVAALREVGMPAVLESLAELKLQVGSHLADVRAAIQEERTAAGHLGTDVQGLSGAVQTGLGQVQSSLADVSKQVHEEIQISEGRMAAKLRSLRLVVVGGIAIATGLGAANLVLILMNR